MTANFPEVVTLGVTAASIIAKHIRSIFARGGIPKTVITDLGLQFKIREVLDSALAFSRRQPVPDILNPMHYGNA